MALSPKGKVQKGKAFEDECAAYWSAMLNLNIRRGVTGKGPDLEAIQGQLPVHVECKHQRSYKPYDWIEQAYKAKEADKPAIVQFKGHYKTKRLILLDDVDLLRVVAALKPFLPEKWEDHPADHVY